MSNKAQSLECSVKRIIPGQATPVPGTFRIQGNQLQWAPQNSADGQSFKVALEAITGTLQKAKAKPQLRVATVSGPLMLEFGSMEERDAVIARITPLLVRNPQGGGGSNIEPTGPLAAVKKQLLEEDKELKHLYGEVVKGGFILDTDFWKSRQSMVLRKAGSAGDKQQVVGLSSALLAQFLPGADGKKSMTMNITPQFIQQVFAEKPHVHRAFVENVPQKMDEKEFWTRFAKHEIQMQARRGSTKRSHEPPDPLFSKAGPTAAASLDNRTIDPTVNLSVDNYDRSASANAEQPYGQGLDSIANDMNRHSAVVLNGPGALNQPSAARQTGAAMEPSEEGQRKWEGRGGSGLEDLRKEDQEETEGLHIRDPRRYFQRAPQVAGENVSRQPQSREAIAASLAAPVNSLGVEPLAVAQVLEDLHQEWTSALPDTWVTNMTSARLVPQMQSLLRQVSLVCNELLRHLWGCLPLRASAAREKRAGKLKDTLEAKYTQLERMQEAAQASERAMVVQFLKPVKQAIDAALEAYQAELQPVQR